MMLRLNAEDLQGRIADCNAFRTAGKLLSAREILTAHLPAAVGELCEIRLADHRSLVGEVVGVHDDCAQIMCFQHPNGLRAGLDVVATGRHPQVPVGEALLGRVLDGLGRPIDNAGPLGTRRTRTVTENTPHALQRNLIHRPLVTGQRVIDGLLTIGMGQRIGLFAGSGVGKSTLLGEIAKQATADLNVIALVGERGREVRPFLEECLGQEGRQRSVTVVATSDETPLMRIQSVRTAITIAEDFREQGANVLLFLDSLTRLAMSQRELGLARGEPPGQRGYPPSVQSLLANVLERLGTDESGSITGLITVLVDGDDMDEPIADAARSILDGHIQLDRKLAAKGHFPAVDVLGSISRLFRDVTAPEHQQSATQMRRILATYAEVSDLIQIGAYQQGTSPEIDRAIQLIPVVQRFLRQEIGESCPFSETTTAMDLIAKSWQQPSAGSAMPGSA
ncbi:FliI/YscN family ATPase [Maioricimonas rarisocia]|uniref:FliI/YscN family ATPase n=1 Tax=Maioricimonas rarisocia TaxID=2528026 RepID=UPI0018D219C9|nr:FliI/YscN family ATPase [Maioricimonas rarisocia]